eukprot:1100323-Pelagomonas_calceolata.AAC.6
MHACLALACFRWKSTVGPPERRPGHPNANWGYWSTDGLGLVRALKLFFWSDLLRAVFGQLCFVMGQVCVMKPAGVAQLRQGCQSSGSNMNFFSNAHEPWESLSCGLRPDACT